MTARRVPVHFSGTTSKGVWMSMGRDDESCGICVYRPCLRISRMASSVCWKLRSADVSLWSLYNTLSMALVQAL